MVTPGLSQIVVMKAVEMKSYGRKILDKKATFSEICSQLIPETQWQNSPTSLYHRA